MTAGVGPPIAARTLKLNSSGTTPMQVKCGQGNTIFQLCKAGNEKVVSTSVLISCFEYKVTLYMHELVELVGANIVCRKTICTGHWQECSVGRWFDNILGYVCVTMYRK